MRLNNPSRQYRPGAVRGRGQWVALGLVLGAIIALAVNTETGWIVRRQLAIWHPDAQSLVNSVQIVEFQNYVPVDDNIRDRANAVTENASHDVAIQIAGHVFTSVADTVRLMEIHNELPAAQKRKTSLPNDDVYKQIKRARKAALDSVYRSHTGSPTVTAAYIRELLASGTRSDRGEFDWIRGKNTPSKPQSKPAKGNKKGNVDDTVAQYDTRVAQFYSPATLRTMEDVARNGIRLDSQNAYFPMMLADSLYMQHRDAEALRTVECAAHCLYFNDYAIEVAKGWQRLDEAIYGTTEASVGSSRFGSGVDFSSVQASLDVAQITVWKAIELEHRGRYREGVSLRMLIASVGSLQNRYRRHGFFEGTLDNLVLMSAIGPGGKFIPPIEKREQTLGGYTVTDDDRPRHAEMYTEAYIRFLDRNDFISEAKWFKEVFKAQYKQANIESITNIAANSNPTLLDNLEQKLQPGFIRVLACWILAQTALAAIVAMALSAIGYRRRFVPKHEVYWSRYQWGCVLSGTLIATFLLIGCSMLYIGDNAWPLAESVVVAVGIAQLVLRRSSYGDTPMALVVHSLCFTACLFIVAGVCAIPIHNVLIYLIGERVSGYPSFLNEIMPFGIGLLAVPALGLFGVMAVHRVRYQGIPSGLFHGTRKVIVPVISVLFLLWAINIAVIAGIEKDIRQGICENLGLRSDADLR